MCAVGEIATGRALVRGGCDKVIFIGSTAVGRCVMRDAADSLTPVTLELGGKDPFIVCDDADMRQATSTAMRAAFQSCGQNCVAAERFLVQAPVYEEFVTTCGALARAMRQGPPLGAPLHCLLGFNRCMTIRCWCMNSFLPRAARSPA